MNPFVRIGGALVCLSLAILMAMLDPCTLPFVCYDSSAVRAIEARELTDGSAAFFRKNERSVEYFRKAGFAPTDLDVVPRPLRASIHEREATLEVAGPLDAHNFYYAQVWNAVYKRHHWWGGATGLTVVWHSGQVHQVFPFLNL